MTMPTDEPEFAQILHEIDRVDGCPRTKQRIKSILRTRTGQRIRFSVRAFVHPERVHAAVLMLEAGKTRAEAKGALCARYGASEATAYRILDAAIAKRRPKLQGGLFDG